MRKLFVLGMAAAAAMTFTASKAMATDVLITPLKLIIVDKIVSTGTAKAVFVAKDLAVTKGTGTNVAAISSTFDVSFPSGAGPQSGSFTNPSGGNWLVNKDTVAKYVNSSAPSGGSTKVSVIKPAKLIKEVGKSLGDDPIDISSAPTGAVSTVYTISNDGIFKHCGQFDGPTCAHKSIAGGTGWKLVCKGNGSAPGACPASPSGAFVD